ncbi:Inner membrane symporter yicJ [Serratia fonticola]|uniref:Inner membrane symporter yicJ n=1 Tax=Serratia fonticola TaxID=47917 RepID=A0A4U9VV87_SERFO|nr:Inner membrane symporter yicJ [Serratia fonticola]
MPCLISLSVTLSIKPKPGTASCALTCLYGAVPLGILTVLCFSTFDSDYKFYYALITYTLYCLAYTAVNTPYSAMTNMLTQHEGSRASLSVYRFVLAIVGYLIVSTTADVLISQFTDSEDGLCVCRQLL